MCFFKALNSNDEDDSNKKHIITQKDVLYETEAWCVRVKSYQVWKCRGRDNVLVWGGIELTQGGCQLESDTQMGKSG